MNNIKNESGHALDAAVFSTCVRLYVCMFTTVHHREHQNAVVFVSLLYFILRNSSMRLWLSQWHIMYEANT